jgi:hypothetical protein
MPRILGNPKVDYVTAKLTEEKAHFETAAKQFAKPMSPRPFPLLAPLTGNFVNPSFGEAAVEEDGDTLVMEIRATAPSSSSRRGTATSLSPGSCHPANSGRSLIWAT